MKKIFSILAIVLGFATSALAKSEYSVEIDLGTKEVTIVQDGVAIQGKLHTSPAIAMLKLTKKYEPGHSVRTPQPGGC